MGPRMREARAASRSSSAYWIAATRAPTASAASRSSDATCSQRRRSREDAPFTPRSLRVCLRPCGTGSRAPPLTTGRAARRGPRRACSQPRGCEETPFTPAAPRGPRRASPPPPPPPPPSPSPPPPPPPPPQTPPSRPPRARSPPVHGGDGVKRTPFTAAAVSPELHGAPASPLPPTSAGGHSRRPPPPLAPPRARSPPLPPPPPPPPHTRAATRANGPGSQLEA